MLSPGEASAAPIREVLTSERDGYEAKPGLREGWRFLRVRASRPCGPVSALGSQRLPAQHRPGPPLRGSALSAERPPHRKGSPVRGGRRTVWPCLEAGVATATRPGSPAPPAGLLELEPLPGQSSAPDRPPAVCSTRGQGRHTPVLGHSRLPAALTFLVLLVTARRGSPTAARLAAP